MPISEVTSLFWICPLKNLHKSPRRNRILFFDTGMGFNRGGRIDDLYDKKPPRLFAHQCLDLAQIGLLLSTSGT